ncbi:MAG TPA: SGNH/GDSL hydrolase family protein [Nocardioidaceae bacterium]|nr:SGNH/GDSL hydrolase family protein [Nocardioidaceae bacterium]
MSLSRWSRSVRTLVVVAAVALVATGMVTTGLWHDESKSADGPITPIRQPNQDAPEVLWVGDSYTVGHGTPGPAYGYPCLISARLNWTCKLDAQGGTGFINDGTQADPSNVALPDRLEDTSQKVDPDLVVIDAGRNDYRATPAAMRHTVNKYLADAHAAFPDARFVVILPFVLGQSRFDYSMINFTIRRAARNGGDIVIDTTTPAWRRYIAKLPTVDGLHPTARSHRLLARQFTKTFRHLRIPQRIRQLST